jgi:hypothetical protein
VDWVDWVDLIFDFLPSRKRIPYMGSTGTPTLHSMRCDWVDWVDWVNLKILLVVTLDPT